MQPNGGELLYVGTSYPVRWEKIFVDLVKLEYSTDGGTNWNLIADGVDGNRVSGGERIRRWLLINMTG